MPNQLQFESSLYLRQHADNPVAWYPWGRPAFDAARAMNRPVLLSIGYAACHWCHVMAHESFENPTIAALMNDGFICIKVDREQRPDLDHLYMSALHAMGQQGGWPLTIFLDPDGSPFWGGTYFAPEPRYGQPSFPQILRAIQDAFHTERDRVAAGGAALRAALQRIAAASPGPVPDSAQIAAAAASLISGTDPLHGGMRGAPKFPNAPIFRFLWQHGTVSANPAATGPVHTLLRQIAMSGLHDCIGGGFARYAVDAEWRVPHFEKMLYDNAQLLELFAFAYATEPDPLYHDAANGIVTWLLREMRQSGAEPEDFAFAAAQDADSEGEEGRFYVWTEAEIDTLLGSRAAEFKPAFDVTPGGNWEGRTILRRRSPLTTLPDPFAPDRATLFAARQRRPAPSTDTKILVDWNGLAIIALCRAASIFRQPDWLGAAQSVYRTLRAQFFDPTRGFAHAGIAGRPIADGLLDDQAAMARAAIALADATADPAYLDHAADYLARTDLRFGDPDGSYFLTASDASDLPALAADARPRTATDQAVPAGIGLVAGSLASLYHLTGKDAFRARCVSLITSLIGHPAGPTMLPSLLSAAETLARGGVIEIHGPAEDGATRALLTEARGTADPSLGVRLVPGSGTPFRQTCRGGICVRD